MIPQSYEALVSAPSICGRIAAQDRNSYMVQVETTEVRAQLTGTLRHQALPSDLPVVGDYVSIRIHQGGASIESVLPRKNLFARRAVDGSHCLQAIAANLDTLFIAIAVNKDFNLRRLERYVVAATAYGVPVAAVLTKTDLTDDLQAFLDSAGRILRNVPLLPVCASERRGLNHFDAFRGTEKTIAFVGSSGVGKSTLINALLEKNMLAVSEIRKHDDRGQHTTTRRMMLHLDDGTAIIDTPGMREFALADSSEGMANVFEDVSEFAQQCRFRDCRHEEEPGCAVREAVDESRLISWRKLEREAAFETRKVDKLAAQAEKEKWKSIHKENRSRERSRYRNL